MGPSEANTLGARANGEVLKMRDAELAEMRKAVESLRQQVEERDVLIALLRGVVQDLAKGIGRGL